MSRHGYSEDFEDNLELGRWRAQVMSSIRGKRGQAMLTKLRDALDAMEDKRLAGSQWKADDGCMCAFAALADHTETDDSAIKNSESEHPDYCDYDDLARNISSMFNITEQLAREVMWVNDERSAWLSYCVHGPREHPDEYRWRAVRKWVNRHIAITP